jgi:hypothetical protein
MAALRQSIENDQTPPAAAAAKRAKGKRTAKGNPAQREILGKRSACETVAKARRAEKGGIVLRRPVSIEPFRLIQGLTCADNLCCGGLGQRRSESWPPREAAMLLIPVVLVIGGILALVLYLEKRSPPHLGR